MISRLSPLTPPAGRAFFPLHHSRKVHDLKTIKEQHHGISYVAWPHVDDERLSVTAQLMRGGKPFFTIEDGASVVGCTQASMRGFAVAMVEACINEEIALAESSQHPAGQFLIPDKPKEA